MGFMNITKLVVLEKIVPLKENKLELLKFLNN
jgi:hypothetical protein